MDAAKGPEGLTTVIICFELHSLMATIQCESKKSLPAVF